MENYRKGTNLEVIFEKEKLHGFYRAWVDCKKGGKALVIDQTYPQHVDFIKMLYHLNNEKGKQISKNQALTKDYYQDCSRSKILNAEDIQEIEEIKKIYCPVCYNPMQRNASLTTPQVYWFCTCFGHSFGIRRIIEIIENKKERLKPKIQNIVLFPRIK